MAEYLAHVDDIERGEMLIRRAPVLQDRSDPFRMYDDDGFLYRYHFTKHGVMDIMELIGDQLQAQSKACSVPPIYQLLITLQFFGSGTYLRNVADLFGVHISTISRIIERCSRALASLHRQFINFPENGEIHAVQEQFYAIGGLPGIVVAIDCMHIPIQSPGTNQAELFRNRKGFFSINVQGLFQRYSRYI